MLVNVLGWTLESDEHITFKFDDEDASTEAGDSTLSPPPPNQLAETATPAPSKPNSRYVGMTDIMSRGTRKILVYIEFPMMAPLLLSILKLFNIIPLIIHGGHGAEERNETVEKFRTDPHARVLIFSSVGAVGLNLTVASVVILFVSVN
jgi:SNF2 family DNA or RNA helicase